MKGWLFLSLFILGVGIAFLVTEHFTTEQSKLRHWVSSNVGCGCNIFCCLPDDIQLSSSQKKQIKSLEGNYDQRRDTLSLEIDQKRLAVAEILLQPKPDLSAIDNLLADIAKLQTELEKRTIRHLLEIKSQLTPEQQNKFMKPIVDELRRCCYQRCLSESAP